MKGEFTRNLSVWNPTVGVASYVAAFSWYFFGLICWMRDDLPLLSSPSTRMCTSLSFFESAAVRRFNIAKYKKAQVKDTWMLPDAHPGLGGSEISGTLYCMRRQAPICVTFIHRDWSSAQARSPSHGHCPGPGPGPLTVTGNPRFRLSLSLTRRPGLRACQ